MLIDSVAALRFAFCGNRFFVLEEMLLARLNVVSIAAVSGSQLESTLKTKNTAYRAVGRKADFLEWLSSIVFDVFVSNGCPYIVPAEYLTSSVKLCRLNQFDSNEPI
jgi:methionyl-tRNA formyltransferase